MEMNYDRFFSDIARNRQPCFIKKYAFPLEKPKYVMDGGFPHGDSFPFESADIKLKDGTSLTLSGKVMDDALMYANAQGYHPLLEHIRELQKRVHNPPNWENRDVIVTAGGIDGLAKVSDMLLNQGDLMLFQEPGYSTYLGTVSAYRPQLIPMEEDEQGIIPQSVRKALSRWTPEQCRNALTGVPKVMYLVPNSSNPSGTMLSLERRKELYQIAREYDLIIMEDDAYYFLQFTGEYIPSFLSMDVDGRVIRFDTFSKTISAGMRLGYVTSPKPLHEKILINALSGALPSAWSMVVVSELLTKWGFEGYMKHIDSVKGLYRHQCSLVTAAADKWLTGLAEWEVPKGGMFLWMKIIGVKDSKDFVLGRLKKKGVAVIPGVAFAFSKLESPYIRLAYCRSTAEQIDAAFRLLAEAIREEQGTLKISSNGNCVTNGHYQER